MEMNGMERTPDRGESLGRTGIGPFKKNFDIPNELESKLRRKDTFAPYTFPPPIVKTILIEICTYNN